MDLPPRPPDRGSGSPSSSQQQQDDTSAITTEVVGPAAVRRFRVVSTIGMGSFGVVHRASVWGTTQSCALKTISKDGRTLQEVEILKREIKISRGMNHIGIVLTVWAFETAACLVVVQERALGDLYRILRDDSRLPEPRVKDIGRQLVSALEHIHSKGVIHRDLKPQNILVLSGGRVALCDFGFARAVSANTALLTTIKGTPLYMAPEVVQECPYNHTADIWSLGVILYELYQGAPPFWGDSLVALMRKVVRRPFSMPGDISTEFASFLNMTLEKDPGRRISWPQLSSHPFVALNASERASMAFLPAESGMGSHLQQQQNARFESAGRARLSGLFKPRTIVRVNSKGEDEDAQSSGDTPRNRGPIAMAAVQQQSMSVSLNSVKAGGVVALPPPLPPVTRSTSTLVTGDQNEEVAKVISQLGEMKPITRSESASSSAHSPLMTSTLAKGMDSDETDDERSSCKELLDLLFLVHQQTIGMPSEEEVLGMLRSTQSRRNFLMRFVERLEASKSSRRWETVHVGTRIFRRLLRLGVQIPTDGVRVIVSYLVADEDSRIAVQGLKCLDTIVSKDHSSILNYVLKPTYTPRLVECPLVPLLLECFQRNDDDRLIKAATHVSLSLLSIPSGWRVSRLFAQHLTRQALEMFFEILGVESEELGEGEGGDTEETANLQAEMLRILSRLCACPSGTVARSVANSSPLRTSIERFAFASSHVQNWPAISVVEYLCRFGCASQLQKDRWVTMAIDKVISIAGQSMSLPTLLNKETTASTTATSESLVFTVNALLRVVLEGSVPGYRFPSSSANEFLYAVLGLLQKFSVAPHRDLETFYAIIEQSAKVWNLSFSWSRLSWDALWKTTRHPNETVHALHARLNVFLSSSSSAVTSTASTTIITTKWLIEKLPVLLGEALSKRFIQSVEQYPKSLGGGRFGARRMVKAGMRIVEEALKRSISRPQDATLLIQQLFDLDAARLLTFHAQRFLEEDQDLVALYGRVFVLCLQINCSKSAKAMMEQHHMAELLLKVMDIDFKSGLKIFSGWSRAGGSAFELCLSRDAMREVLKRLTAHVMGIVHIKRSQTQQSRVTVDDTEDVKEICAAVGNVCRRTGRFYLFLSELFQALGDYVEEVLQEQLGQDHQSFSQQMNATTMTIEDSLVLAVGNAAFHSEVLYPVLRRFVPALLNVLGDTTAEAKTRANAALAIGNLLRNGDSNDAFLAQSDGCAVLLKAYRASRDILERRVILLSLGNFAGRPQCRAILQARHFQELTDVVEKSLADADAEVKTAAQRISEKLQQQQLH